MKKEHNLGRWSKLSIISFTLLILAFFLSTINYLFKMNLMIMGIFSSLLILLSIIFAIVSLIQIKKYNLKGKLLSILTLVIAIILVITGILGFIFIFYIFSNMGKVNYYTVPIEFTLSASNLQLTPTTETKNPDIFIFDYNNQNPSEIPENCSLERFSLSFSPTDKYNYLHSKDMGSWRYGSPNGKYPSEKSGEYIFWIKEPNNKKREIKRVLSNNQGDYELFYFFSAFVQTKASHPAIYESDGCQVHYPKTSKYEKLISIKGMFNQEFNLDSEQIICLKEFKKDISGNLDLSTDDCFFIKITSKVDLSLEMDPSKGEQDYITEPIF
jgi:hypothetical protein